MRLLGRFTSVKTRLLALMAVVIVPVAVFTLLLAAATDSSLSAGIERNWRDSTANYVKSTRVWAAGALNIIDAAGSSVASPAARAEDCDAVLRDVLAAEKGLIAIEITSPGRQCRAASGPAEQEALDLAVERLKPEPSVTLEGQSIGLASLTTPAGSFLALRGDPSGARTWTAIGLFKPTLIDALFDPNPQPSDEVALVESDGRVIASAGPESDKEKWLPAERRLGDSYLSFSGPSRSGETNYYASEPALGPRYFILRRFDATARRNAWLRFLVLALAPLATLACLYAVYSRAIQSEVLRWIDGIKSAIVAKRRGQSLKALAPVDDEMPAELRDFAIMFNEMTRDSAVREESLKRSVAENEHLLRELHHRVKNSLQVIQSYLALTRRLDGHSQGLEAIAAMEARVQVIAIAYRKAFSEGRMRDVRVRLFVEEVMRNLAQGFRRPGVALELIANVSVALMIDRAIPLGLALVEAVMAGIRAEGAHGVAVRLFDHGGGRLELRVSTDGLVAPGRPDARLMAGLAQQLGATVEPGREGSILSWSVDLAPQVQSNAAE